MNTPTLFGRARRGWLLDILVLVAVLGLLALPARAQHGYDAFGAMRTLQVGTPTNIVGTGNGAYVTGITSGPVDIRLFTGTVKLDIFSHTNSGGATTMNALPESSVDTTNWTALANYANATAASIAYTNTWYGSTNLYVTDSWLLPGTITTPTAATAGFATPYLLGAPFTNSGALAISTRGWYSIGFNAEDAPRYFHIVWLPTGGTLTNISVGAIITGKTTVGPP